METPNETNVLLRTMKGKIENALFLGKSGLLKSEELYEIKYHVEDELKKIASAFPEIEQRKIDKGIPKWRNEPRRGLYVHQSEAVAELLPLNQLLDDLISSGPQNDVPMIEPLNIEAAEPSLKLAIENAKTLLATHGASSAVDRMHTALHSFLRTICSNGSIKFEQEDSIGKLFAKIRESHPKFNDTDSSSEVEFVLKSIPSTLVKLNEIRNSSSLAHSNNLLPEPEAEFVVNLIQAVMRYLVQKLNT